MWAILLFIGLLFLVPKYLPREKEMVEGNHLFFLLLSAGLTLSILLYKCSYTYRLDNKNVSPSNQFLRTDPVIGRCFTDYARKRKNYRR